MTKKELSFGLRVKRIDMGIFDHPIYCVIGNHKKLKAYLEWKFDDKDIDTDTDYGEAPRGQTWSRKGYVPVIWIPRKPVTPREYSTVAHEAYHAVCKILRWACIEHTPDTEELVAHSIGHVVNEILK